MFENIKLFFSYFVIGLVIAGTIFYFFCSSVGSSEGQHTGYVTAVEYNSNIIWDANIVYFKTDTQSTQEDRYCVNDEALKKELELYAKNNVHVTIFYENPFILWKSQCNGGSSIIIDAEVEVVE